MPGPKRSEEGSFPSVSHCMLRNKAAWAVPFREKGNLAQKSPSLPPHISPPHASALLFTCFDIKYFPQKILVTTLASTSQLFTFLRTAWSGEVGGCDGAGAGAAFSTRGRLCAEGREPQICCLRGRHRLRERTRGMCQQERGAQAAPLKVTRCEDTKLGHQRVASWGCLC